MEKSRPMSTRSNPPGLGLLSPSTGAWTVGTLHLAQERAVAMILARAFVDDLLVRAICGGTEPSLERITWSFRIAVRGHCLSPQPGWTISEPSSGIAGVALVSRPSMLLQSRSDTWFTLRALRHVGLRAARRGMQAAETIAAHAPPAPYLYLRTLGVDPSMQGRGIGSRLLRQVIDATPPTWPLYLETAKERNLAFYAKHGLQCMGSFHCLNVRIWRLQRPASTRIDLRDTDAHPKSTRPQDLKA